MNDCYDISVLPNYNDNCWLNTIFMCVLYSQYSRDLLISLSKNWNIDNPFLKIIMNIINSYYSNSKNLEPYFNELVPAKLLYEIQHFKLNIEDFKERKWTEMDIIDLYRFLGVNCVDIIFDNNQRYLLNFISQTSSNLNNNPDVLIFYHWDLNSDFHKFISRSKLDLTKYQIDTSKIDVGTLATYADEITFMGDTYILSSCICNNNTFGYKHHSVAGIVCNNKKMVYNSYENKTIHPCSLINHQWDLKKSKDVCLNPNECQIDLKRDIKKIGDLCFNFGVGNRTLIYVKKVNIDLTIDMKKNQDIEFKKEPIISDIQEEIVKIKEMSDISLYYQFEKISGNPINITDICKEGINRDDLEKIILENNIKSIIKVQGGKNLSLNKFNKKELITMINKNLNKCKKNKLVSLYQQLKN